MLMMNTERSTSQWHNTDDTDNVDTNDDDVQAQRSICEKTRRLCRLLLKMGTHPWSASRWTCRVMLTMIKTSTMKKTSTTWDDVKPLLPGSEACKQDPGGEVPWVFCSHTTRPQTGETWFLWLSQCWQCWSLPPTGNHLHHIHHLAVKSSQEKCWKLENIEARNWHQNVSGVRRGSSCSAETPTHPEKDTKVLSSVMGFSTGFGAFVW